MSAVQEDPLRHEKIDNDLGCTRGFSHRADVSLVCEVRQGTRAWQKVTLDDISQSGFRIARFPGANVDIPLRIRIPGIQLLTAHIRWKEAMAVGCEFGEPLHVAVFENIVRQARIGDAPGR
jgi:hypothetical protein